MQRDRLGDAVHGQIAHDIATLRACLFHAPARERDLSKFAYVEKFRAPQMVVPLSNPRIDAADIDLCHHRRIFRMIAVDVDRAAEFFELAIRDSKVLMNFKADTRMHGIDLVNLIRGSG